MVGMARVWYMHGTYELVWVDWDLPGTMAFRCSCQGSADLWMSNLGVSAMGLCSEWLTVARLLCDLFRLETPNTVGHSVSLQVGEVFGCNSLIHEVRPYVGSCLHGIPSHKLTSRAEDFTTIRIQKFASAVTRAATGKVNSSTFPMQQSSELYLLQWFLLYKAQVTRCSIHKLNKSLEEKSAVQPFRQTLAALTAPFLSICTLPTIPMRSPGNVYSYGSRRPVHGMMGVQKQIMNQPKKCLH